MAVWRVQRRQQLVQETVNVQRGSESGNNQFNSFLQGGEGLRAPLQPSL